MADEDTRLLVELSQKLGALDGKVDILQKSIDDSVKRMADSVAVLNHNSTSMADNIAKITRRLDGIEANTKAVKKIKKSTRNWIVTIAALITAIAAALAWIVPYL